MERMMWIPSEVRAAESGRTVAGIAVPYDQQGTGPKGPEVVKPGALTRTLAHLGAAQKRMKAFRNHEYSTPVGTIEKLEDTAGGLLVEVRLADTAAGDETLREVRAGMVDAFSIGFTAKREALVNGVRELREIALHEVSLVSLPAYPGAVVTEVRQEPAVDYSRYMPPPIPDDVADWC